MTEPDQLYGALAYVIRHWRLAAGMSQKYVYEAAHLNKNVYTRLEDPHSSRPVTAAQIQAIARVYTRDGWQLLREAELLLAHGVVPALPRSVREWKKMFG